MRNLETKDHEIEDSPKRRKVEFQLETICQLCSKVGHVASECENSNKYNHDENSTYKNFQVKQNYNSPGIQYRSSRGFGTAWRNNHNNTFANGSYNDRYSRNQSFNSTRGFSKPGYKFYQSTPYFSRNRQDDSLASQESYRGSNYGRGSYRGSRGYTGNYNFRPRQPNFGNKPVYSGNKNFEGNNQRNNSFRGRYFENVNKSSRYDNNKHSDDKFKRNKHNGNRNRNNNDNKSSRNRNNNSNSSQFHEDSAICRGMKTAFFLPAIIQCSILFNPTKALCDTGSTINLIYSDTLSVMAKNCFKVKKKPTIVRAFDAHNTEISESVLIEFSIHERKFQEEFLMVKCDAPNAYSMILGHNFLAAHKAVIDFKSSAVVFPEFAVSFIGHKIETPNINTISITDDKVQATADPAVVDKNKNAVFDLNININHSDNTINREINNENSNGAIESANVNKGENINIDLNIRQNNADNRKIDKQTQHLDKNSNSSSLSSSACSGTRSKGKLLRKVVLKPAAESLVLVKSTYNFDSGDTILIEPAFSNGKVFIARSVSFANENEFLVKVANISDKEVYLNKGLKLVNLEKVVEVAQHEINLIHETTDFDKNDEFEATGGDFDLSHLPFSQKQQLLKLLKKYDNVFARSINDLVGCDTIKHRIHLTDDRPVRQRAYRVPQKLQQEMQKQITELLEADIIRPSTSPFNSPVLFVRKADGSFRMVCDFRNLNKNTVAETFPIPNITDLIDSLAGGKFFTSLDLACGFHQVKIHDKDCFKTAFSTPQGHFEWQRLPFGMRNSPASFQRLMSLVLSGNSGVYIDDIIVSSKTFSEHLVKLEDIFKRLQKHNLKLKPSKCHFFRKSIKYLGFKVSEGKVQPDPTNIEIVKNFKVPENRKQVRQFLGLSGFYRKFINNYAKIALPLTTLTKTSEKFAWNQEAQEAFETLKQKLVTEPILILPDFEKQFVLYTDASKYALGAVLAQLDEKGFPMPVAYASRKLQDSEVRYSVIEKEALGIVWACKYFKPYLIGTEFTIFCDQASLSYVMKHKDPTARIARWMLSLNEFTYKIIHKPGRFNITADYLSRYVKSSSDSLVAESNAISRKQQSEISVKPALRERIKVEQEKDPKCLNIMKKIAEGRRVYPRHLDFFLEDDILMVGHKLSKNRRQARPRYYLPESLVHEVVQLCHDSVFAAHAGFPKTLNRISTNYYWKGMHAQIQNYVDSCETCLKSRGYKHKSKAPVQKFEEAKYPFHRIGMDVIGPITQSSRGNKYILVITDHFTRWPEAYPLPSIKSEDILFCLERFIARHGVPAHIVTDQGTNFLSNAAMVLYKKLGIVKHSTTPYHPQADGMVEKLNSVLINSLRNLLHNAKEDWDRVLHLALLAHRSSVHSSTGETPSYLMYGRDLQLPDSLLADAEHLNFDTVNDYSKDLQYRLQQAFKQARANSNKARDDSLKYRNKNAKNPVFDVGSKVYLYTPVIRPGETKKLTALNRGSYTVTRKISPVTFEILSDSNPNDRKVVHADRLTNIPKRRVEVSEPTNSLSSSTSGINITRSFSQPDKPNKDKQKCQSQSQPKRQVQFKSRVINNSTGSDHRQSQLHKNPQSCTRYNLRSRK